MIIDGEGDRIDKKAPDIFFDSPENVIADVPVDAIEQLFASHAAERKAAVLEFTPDEIRITAENKFDDGIYELLYSVWKETSGKYVTEDDKPIVDPRGNTTTKNETKFKYWAMEQYGMTAEEYRGYTVEGTLKTLGEIDMAKDKVMIALALPGMIKNATKTVKDVANGVPVDTSIGFAAGNSAATNGPQSKIQEVLDIADNYTLTNHTFNTHIIVRHGPNSKIKSKTHFNKNFDIKKGIDSTLKGGDFSIYPNTAGRDGYIFRQTFPNAIGTSTRGKPLYTLKVVIDNVGNVVTAFPEK